METRSRRDSEKCIVQLTGAVTLLAEPYCIKHPRSRPGGVYLGGWVCRVGGSEYPEIAPVDMVSIPIILQGFIHLRSRCFFGISEPSKWLVSMVSFCPLRIGLWDLFQIA